MKLRFLGGRYQGRVIDIIEQELSIGRGNSNQLTVDEDGVSRRHCRVVEEEGQWYVEDLDSTNGVRVNGQKIKEKTAINNGDRIGVGNSLMLFTDGSDFVDPAALTNEKLEPSSRSIQPASGTSEKTSFPWFRIILLILIIAAIVQVARQSLTDSDDSGYIFPDEGTAGETVFDAAPASSDDTGERVIEVAEEGGVVANETETSGPVEEETSAAARPGQQRSVPFLVMSEPEGAAVYVNDREKGTTPLLLRDIEPGRHILRLKKEGYDELVRHFQMPELLPDAPYVLKQKAGTLKVITNPPNATVAHGTQILGNTPLLIASLPAGDHEFRLVLPGYKSMTKEASISKIRGEELVVELPSRIGGLSVLTEPGGCSVYVDDAYKGETAETGLGEPPVAMEVFGLLEGEHRIKVVHPVGLARKGRVRVRSNENTKCPFRFYIIDTIVELTDGKEVAGMLRERNQQGDIVLEEKPEKLVRYLNPQVKTITELSVEESRKAMQHLLPAESKNKGDEDVEQDRDADEPEAF